METMDNQHRDECTAHLSAFCPTYHHAIELIGRRWTGAILRAMLSGEARFSDITSVVPGLSDRLLSERLKELEAEGIVTRTGVEATTVRVTIPSASSSLRRSDRSRSQPGPNGG